MRSNGYPNPMHTRYLYITGTLADRETVHVLAELQSGLYLSDPMLKYTIRLWDKGTLPAMGGIRLEPDILGGMSIWF